MMKEAVFSQALLLAGELEEQQKELLRVLCSASSAALAAGLKEGITAQDCQEAFVAAASLYALAALRTAREDILVEEFKAGDLSVKQSNTGANTSVLQLEKEADRVIRPYLKDSFAFVGV